MWHNQQQPFLLCLFFSFCFFLSTQATVPPSARFSYSNSGEFGDYIVEYDANYRFLPIARTPFQMFFYNTTPGQYTLALRMGTVRSESLMRWVWEANRGNPVGENATFSLGANGNLVLAHSDGRVAWQSNTANKGVTGLQLLNTGNLVLVNSRGEFVWQSFDSPTDTLLVGQSLRIGGANKLTSRLSAEQNQDGPYSFVLEPRDLALYFTTPAISRTPYRYFSFAGARNLFVPNQSTLQNATFSSRLGFDQGVTGVTTLKNPRFNTTLSYFRLEIDGNLKIHTFIIANDTEGDEFQRWETAVTVFSEDDPWALDNKCQLPGRCGDFGVCEDGMCVACPTANGLMGWSKECKPPAVNVNNCSGRKFKYFELKGIDHFMAKYTRGDSPVTKPACEEKCSKDCKCLGYFYQSDSSRCQIAYELKTMSRVANQTHLAYIKTPIA
ncbi:EP1-like glycoprotein 4 [Linum grandiflorum]